MVENSADHWLADVKQMFAEVAKLSRENEQRFREIAREFKETDGKFKETDGKFKETDEKFKETDEKFKETDGKFKETDEKFKEIMRGFEELKEESKETDRRFRKTNEQFEKTDRKIEQTMQMIDKLNRRSKRMEDEFLGRWGRFMEVLIHGGASNALAKIGLRVTHSSHSLREEVLNGHGRGMEVDVCCVGDDFVMAIEVKSRLKVEHVNEHLERLDRFYDCYPSLRSLTLLGAVAGLIIEEDADKYAFHKGLYVLTLEGKNMAKVLNGPGFRPKTWKA